MKDPMGVIAINPFRLNKLSDTLATVTLPTYGKNEDGEDVIIENTVMSVQPDGTVARRPEGTQGPYEIALVGQDRLTFAPLGPNGDVYIFPLAPVIPNA